MATTSNRPSDEPSQQYVRRGEIELTKDQLRTGPAAAATIAAGVGVFLYGLFITLAAASGGFNEAMRWSTAVGPLIGKTALGVIVWLIAWAALYFPLRRRNFGLGLALTIMIVLIVLGLILSFPPFFDLFAGE